MAVDNFLLPSGQSDDARLARCLLDEADWASLGTIDRQQGGPSVSLVQMAVSHIGLPILLISELASHTRNLRQEPRASLLVDRRTAGAATAAVERVTLIGRARPALSPEAQDLFLARHPEARSYVGFRDFAFWQFEVDRLLLVAGFGRIRELQAADVLGQWPPVEVATGP